MFEDKEYRLIEDTVRVEKAGSDTLYHVTWSSAKNLPESPYSLISTFARHQIEYGLGYQFEYDHKISHSLFGFGTTDSIRGLYYYKDLFNTDFHREVDVRFQAVRREKLD